MQCFKYMVTLAGLSQEPIQLHVSSLFYHLDRDRWWKSHCASFIVCTHTNCHASGTMIKTTRHARAHKYQEPFPMQHKSRYYHAFGLNASPHHSCLCNSGIVHICGRTSVILLRRMNREVPSCTLPMIYATVEANR